MLTNKEKQEFLNCALLDLIKDGDNSRVQKALRDLLISDTDGGKLYKYRSFKSGHLHDLLEKQTLYCSKPSSFNDPFDCRIGVDFHSLVEAKYGIEFDRIELLLEMFLAIRCGAALHPDISDAEKAVFSEWSHSEKINQLLEIAQTGILDTEEKRGQYLLEHFDLILELLRPILDSSELKQYFSTTEHIYPKLLENMTPTGIMRLSDSPISLTDYAKANHIEEDTDEIGLTLALNRQLKMASEKDVQKTDSLMTGLGQKVEKALDDAFLIGCLCRDDTNRLMWSHYADSHQGFCIEYDFSTVPDDLLPLPVIYTETRPKMPWKAALSMSSESMHEANRAFMMALLTKDEAWAYEHEWRMIISSMMDPRLKMPPISCVYLGTQCSEENKETVIKLAEHKGFQVRQMVVDRGEYALHSYPVYNTPASVTGKD